MANQTNATSQSDEDVFNIERIKAQLKVWSERLLDLSKSNPLLGINRSRVSKLQIKSIDTSLIFQKLVVDELTIKMPLILIKKKQKKTNKANKDQLSIESEENLQEEPEYEIRPGDIDFEAEPKNLHRLIKRIYGNGRSTVEERGVTTLHLTFGTLNWNDPLLGDSISPLLLIPCQLENLGPNSNMRLRMLDEELSINPALTFYLFKKHHIKLPSFLEDPSKELLIESLKRFYLEVEKCVHEQQWKVEEKSWLSTFSFESLVIYKDLETMAELAYVNPLIAALSKARSITEGSESLDEPLDSLDVPKIVPIPVMPADASQLESLTIAQKGKHLVIKGPPGTGKSQTIANLIAEAIGKGKKVLFVSAKMAALNVVHDRLSKLGLGRFCLEAHSTKAGKLKIIEELKRTLEQPIKSDGNLFDEQLEELKKLKNQLNDYVKEIHFKQEPLGKTIYEIIGKIEKLNKVDLLEFDLPWSDIEKVTQDELRDKTEILEKLAVMSNLFENRSIHPWRGFIVNTEQPISSDILKKNLKIIIDKVENINLSLKQLSDLLRSSKSEFSFNDIKKLLDVLGCLSESTELPKGWIVKTSEDLKDLQALFILAVEKAEKFQSNLKELKEITDLPCEELIRILKPIRDKYSSWSRLINPKFWSWKISIRKYLMKNVNTSYSSLLRYLNLATNLNSIELWFEANNKILSQFVPYPKKNSGLLKQQSINIESVLNLKSLILQDIIVKPKIDQYCLNKEKQKDIKNLIYIIQNKDLETAITLIEANWTNGFINDIEINDSSLTHILLRCNEILNSFQKMHEWIVLQSLMTRCNNYGLSDFLTQLKKDSSKNAPAIFEKRFYTQWLESKLNSNLSLIEFTGSLREEIIKQFKGIDKKLQNSMLKRIQFKASEPAKNILFAQDKYGNGGEVGILRKELQKRKRIKPLRKLFNEIPHVLQALKPCMLMSPISVSTFLAPGKVKFDMVVFDEASQLPTSEAIPSILRGKQIIVAGDENQLPPTNFWRTSTIFEEENEAEYLDDYEPLESLLNDSIAIEPVFNVNRILWHYRSKDERLIKFSNNKFYENSLITFPSATTNNEGRGVHLVYTKDGIWDRGKSRTNRIEAKTVAELVIEHFKNYPDRSLGVVSMNASQKELIENILDELITSKPELQALLDMDCPEPFFVKSLENVQGDERDTIIICVGYAKTSDGSLSLNFGPLNSDGGWRRLNVLVTRAKWQTILVTSLQSHELSGINPLNKGAIMLREYIRYAEKDGVLSSDLVTETNEETNDFEDSIAVSLRDRGLIVDEQVGASEYRIDLAVRDPRDLNRYIMAVECDGATYHHTKTARDRDILRQQVLQSQGWKIYRVWSTDWFRDRDKALKGILTGFEDAKKSPSEESIQAPPLENEMAVTKIDNIIDPLNNKPTSNQRKFKPGIPYHKYLIFRKNYSEELLNKNRTPQLTDMISKIVQFESPIHFDLIEERLKKIYGISRAGNNVKKNIAYAITMSSHWSGLEIKGKFLYKKGHRINIYRTPSEDVVRGIEQIAPEEIENAILYLVEDQFGFAREQLPKAILKVFGIGKNRSEDTENIELAIDNLIKKEKLSLNGHTLYLN